MTDMLRGKGQLSRLLWVPRGVGDYCELCASWKNEENESSKKNLHIRTSAFLH